jgi:hypothetical protein
METVSGVGGSLMRARPKAVAKLQIALPSLDEQRRIVAKIKSVFAHSKRAADELNRIPQLVERYKKVILTAAFRGVLTSDWREGPIGRRFARTAPSRRLDRCGRSDGYASSLKRPRSERGATGFGITPCAAFSSRPLSSRGGPRVRRLAAGGGSLERTRL